MTSTPTFVWRPPLPADRRPLLRLTAQGRNDVRYDVRMIGMLNRHRFLVTHPVHDDTLAFVREGDAFEVGTFDGAAVHAFASVVAEVRLGAHPGLALTLPDDAARRSESVRKARRLPVALPCSVRYGDVGWEVRSGYVADLSTLGARVALELPLPTGVERVRVGFRVDVLGRPQTVHAHARIRSCSADPRPDVAATLYGLEFDALSAEHAVLVHAFVLDRLLALNEDVFAAVH